MNNWAIRAKKSEIILEHCPLIAAGMEHAAHAQIRNRGTIGGSLAHLDPSAEWPALLAVHDATLRVQSKSGERDVPILEWSQGFMAPNLVEDEMLTEITVTAWPEKHVYGFAELARRKGDFALAGAAVLLDFDGEVISRAALALLGVEVGPIRMIDAENLLVGEIPSDELFREAAEHVTVVAGIDDVHASASYRKKVASVMVRRALEQASHQHKSQALAA